MVNYLTTVVQAARGHELGIRNARELRTLAEALDRLLKGELAHCGDLLMQRFKAVESASADANWAAASRYELIPEALVSAVPPEERAVALSLELSERKLQKLTEVARSRESRPREARPG